MNKRWTAIIIAVLFLLSLSSFALVFIGSGHFLRLDCAQLPSLVEARATIENHQGIVQQIEGVNPGFVRVSLFSPDQCPQKAYLIITYATTQDKITIEEIVSQIEAIDDKWFFDVPYVLRNT